MADLVRNAKQLGNAIRRARRRLGMSQGELGERAGVRQGTISEIENGTRGGQLETVLALLAVLGLELQVTARSGDSLADIERDF
ncbi:transcriptional regulator [Spartobacteria bacterium LR76]|nr:transcriptional regulator [Spartobacteria bacterium LR76]